MADPKQIPHLIKLLDDESPDIRKTVVRELESFGLTLKEELKDLAPPLNAAQKGYLKEILDGHKRIWLNRIWPNWLNLLTDRGDYVADYKRLESALSILSEFLSGTDCQAGLKSLLDELAGAYKARYEQSDPVKLAKFLFKEKKLHGDEEDYYNPQNSNLIYVIQEKKGVPISLAAVYMLVGLRLGLKVEGCHFPGHFLARVVVGKRKVFVDCFNGGQIIEKRDLLTIQEGAFEAVKDVLEETSDARTMVRRFLANMIRSYQMRGDEKNSDLLVKLFGDMDAFTGFRRMSELTPEDIINQRKPLFKPGDYVSHAHYGYWGMIVASDDECQATDDWYFGNQTQPIRHQAWYHVLVHDSDQVTYVAESNLVKYSPTKEIQHPLLSHFFKKDKKGRYIRNDSPWPESDF